MLQKELRRRPGGFSRFGFACGLLRFSFLIVVFFVLALVLLVFLVLALVCLDVLFGLVLVCFG